jgi:hypothetical protein
VGVDTYSARMGVFLHGAASGRRSSQISITEPIPGPSW